VTQPYPFFRVCWRVAGERRMQSFRTYAEARQSGEQLVRDLGTGSQVTGLTVAGVDGGGGVGEGEPTLAAGDEVARKVDS